MFQIFFYFVFSVFFYFTSENVNFDWTDVWIIHRLVFFPNFGLNKGNCLNIDAYELLKQRGFGLYAK